MNNHTQSKKFWLIGSFTLSLFLLLVLSVSIKNVNAGTLETATVTPTLVLENWYNTRTPAPLGSCPDSPVNPNHDLTAKYRNDCEQCLMTQTPAYPTSIPKTSTGTVTAVPTNTATPTPTQSANWGLLEAREQKDGSIWVTPTIPAETEKHYSGTGHMPQRGLNFYNTSNMASYKIGFQFWGSVNVINWFGQNQTVLYKIMSPKSPITITFHTGIRAGQTVNVPINTWYETKVFYQVSGWKSWNETLDIQVNNASTTGYSLYVIVDKDLMGTDSGDNYDIYYKWKQNGTFYYPPVEGYCRSEKLHSQGSAEDYFNIKMYPFWIGTGGCISTDSFLGWVNQTWFQDLLTSVFGQGQTFTLPGLNLCFRQFSMSAIKLFGITIDVMLWLYIIVGIYIIKTLLDIA